MSAWTCHCLRLVYQRSRALCIQLGKTRCLLPVLWGLHTCQTNRGELVPALAIANEMLQVADSSNDPLATTEALFAAGSTRGFMGRWADARRALYVLDPCVGSLSRLARLLAVTGDIDQAITRATEAIELAAGLSHPPTLAYAKFWLGFVRHARHEDSVAVPFFESSMALSREQGLHVFLEWGRMVLWVRP